MDWSKPRTPKKSPEELAFDAACRAYVETFGEPYAIYWNYGKRTLAEETDAIMRCIAEGKKQEKPKDAPDGVLI